jgi:hypothetical protein
MAANPQIKLLELRPPKAPNLLIAPVDYTQIYQDQLNNALRLYFNQIDNFGFGLLNTTGGGGLSFPHIAASDSTDQYATANNTPTVVAWDTLDSGVGWTLNAPGSATADVPGIYKITYSAQLVNTDNAIHNATFWLKKDTGSGFVDVPNSATIFSIPARKSAGVPSYVTAYSEVTFDVNSGDVVELWWATEKAYNPTGPVDGVYIYHDVAQTVPYTRPAVPSVIGSITFVSRLPITP